MSGNQNNHNHVSAKRGDGISDSLALVARRMADFRAASK